MKIPTKEQIQWLEEQYPVGTRVVLGFMDDPQAPPPGTKGTVRYVDAMGQIGVEWTTALPYPSTPARTISTRKPPRKTVTR